MYDPKVEVYPYCWLSQQQSFKKQLRNTRSLWAHLGTHFLICCEERKLGMGGTPSPFLLNMPRKALSCCAGVLPCVTMPVGRARLHRQLSRCSQSRPRRLLQTPAESSVVLERKPDPSTNPRVQGKETKGTLSSNLCIELLCFISQ